VGRGVCRDVLTSQLSDRTDDVAVLLAFNGVVALTACADFSGLQVNGVDAKARVSLPAVFRQVIDLRLSGGEIPDGLQRSIKIGKHPRLPCLEAFDPTYVAVVKETTRERAKIKAEAEGLFAGDVYDDLISRVLGRMHDVSYDGTGRMVLPAGLKAKAGIGDDAVFLGAGDVFRIWSPDNFRTEHADDPDLVDDMELALGARKGGRG